MPTSLPILPSKVQTIPFSWAGGPEAYHPLRRGHEANDPRDGQGGRAGPGQVGGTWTREEHFVSLLFRQWRCPENQHRSSLSSWSQGLRLRGRYPRPRHCLVAGQDKARDLHRCLVHYPRRHADHPVGGRYRKTEESGPRRCRPVARPLRAKTLPARPLYWGSLSNNGARSEALRDGNWKLVVQHPKAKPGTFANERIELFRLDKDLGEENNLAEKEPSGPPPCSSNSRHGTPKPRKPPLTNRAAGCRGLKATLPSSTART